MLPILLNFGWFKIYATGAMWGLAAFIGGVAIARAAYRRNYHTVWVWDLLAYGFVGGLAGARVGYFITSPGSLTEGPIQILKIWEGGLSLHWGVLGGIIVGYIYCRRTGISFLQFADIWMPGLSLGLGFSRFGCLLGGHCYGKVCQLGSCFLGITYPTTVLPDNLPTPYPLDGLVRYPAPLYHFGTDFIVYYLLMRYEMKGGPPGRVFAAFLVLYSIGRFIVEYWRDDMVMSYWGLTVAQVASIGLIIIGLGLWIYFCKAAKKRGAAKITIGIGEAQ